MGKSRFSVIGAAALALIASSASAQEEKRKIAVPYDNEQGQAWIEMSFPIARNSIADAIDEAIVNDKGIQVSWGWEPLTNIIRWDDGFAMRLLKSIGIGMDYTDQRYEANFPIPLYDYKYWSSERGKNCGGAGCNDCSWTEKDPFTEEVKTIYGYCWSEEKTATVYGRDAYVKYSSGSTALRAYLPIDIANRIQLQGGMSVRFHRMKEENNTEVSWNRDERPAHLQHLTEPPFGTRDKWSTEATFDAVLRVGVRIVDGLYVGGVVEKSLSGFGYRSASGNISYRFGKIR